MSLKGKANLGVVLYFVFKFVAIVFAIASGGDGPIATPVFYAIFFLGTAFLVWGGSAQARMKGYSGWLGAIALLELLGLIILAMLPHKAHQPASASTSPTSV